MTRFNRTRLAPDQAATLAVIAGQQGKAYHDGLGIDAAALGGLTPADYARASALVSGLAGKADLVGGMVPTSQLPAVKSQDTYPVASQAEMLALPADRGDIAVRSDNRLNYRLAGDDPAILANWIALEVPADAVQSINGQTGIVNLSAANVGALTQAQADTLYRAMGYVPTYTEITGKPTTFAPSAHKASHATGGADALTPADIGALTQTAADGRYVRTVNGTAPDAAGNVSVAAGGASRAVATADTTNANATANTLADATGLAFAASANVRYWFRYVIDYTAAATTTGARFTLNGPAFTRLTYVARTPNTQNGPDNAMHLSGYNSGTFSAGTPTTTGNIAVVEGIILPSAAGSLQLRFSSEVASSAIVVKAGSYVEWGTL